MADDIASLMAKKEYDTVLPLLERDIAKYPSNARTRLQLSDALAGAGRLEEALRQYEETAKYYEDNGLIVQAIAVRKKAEKVRARLESENPAPSVEVDARIPPAVPPSPLFEDFTPEELESISREMVLELYEEGDIIITEGEKGSSLYVIVSGEVKVYTSGPLGESVFLATLGEGEFFGEVSVLTGKPRTATITASQPSELLRLDKDRMDRVAADYPRLRKVLDDFYRRRAKHTVEAMIEALKQGRQSNGDPTDS